MCTDLESREARKAASQPGTIMLFFIRYIGMIHPLNMNSGSMEDLAKHSTRNMVKHRAQMHKMATCRTSNIPELATSQTHFIQLTILNQGLST